MRILGNAAIFAALGGFAVFLSTVNGAYGAGGVAFVLGLGLLFILVPAARARADISCEHVDAQPLATLDPAARG
jgi:hypothetical protein